jgi:hypothetical protein
MTPNARDETPHAPGSAPAWSDAWHLDAATTDGVGLTVRLECYPNRQRAWYWTYLVLPTLPGPVVVRDHDVNLPRQGLEIRAEGLWAELWCETALEHWTYGLEAFAVALDDPADALTGEIGERIPIGLDLEWEVDGTLHTHHEGWPIAGYIEPGIVHGEILLGRERLELDARGEYQRTWGNREPRDTGAWSAGCSSRQLALHVEGLPGGSVDGFIGRSGEPTRIVERATREGHAGAARLVIDDAFEVEMEVLMGAPVPIDAATTLDRALCRFRVGDTIAHGWTSVLEAR